MKRQCLSTTRDREPERMYLAASQFGTAMNRDHKLQRREPFIGKPSLTRRLANELTCFATVPGMRFWSLSPA